MATNQISSQIIQPPENNNKNPSMKKENEEDISGTDDQEDVLSLCDLPVHTVTHDDDHSHDDHQDNSNANSSHQNSSLNVNNQNTLFEFFSEEWSMTTSNCVSKSSTPMNNHDNLFEFFSEEWNVATTNVATTTNAASSATVTSVCVEASNTCGSKISANPSPPRNEKIIASQPQSPSNTSDHPKTLHQKTKKTPQESQEKKTSLIPWKSNSIFTKSMRDSKFLLILFGLPPKIPTDKTELMSDIKIRQSRRAPFTFVPEGSDCRGEGVEPATISRREHALWRFIKAATCFGGQPRENGELDGSVNFVIPHNNSESKTS